MSRASSRIYNLETVGKSGNQQVQVIYISVRGEAWDTSYDMKAGRLGKTDLFGNLFASLAKLIAFWFDLNYYSLM